MDILKGLELEQLRTSALHLPNSPRLVSVPSGNNFFEKIDRHNQRLIDDFSERRLRRTASSASYGDIFAALPRFYTPMDYFEQSKIPYNIQDDKQRLELYKWLDLFYRTHYLIPILIDIFTRFPLVGLELHSTDPQLREFYEDVFFDRLDYEHFLTNLGREYWTLGQSFPLGHFDEDLGVWEEEELLDPSMVKVRRYPIVGGEQLFLVPDESLKRVVEKQDPKEIYYLLQRDYPEMIPFLRQGKDIPISNVKLKQVAFKASPRDLHGTPILLRALRTLMHEEKLMASQDAIAERLYSPLILVKLGVVDMGQNRGPWLPGPAEISQVRNEFDLALAADFRLMVHHFGIEVQNVFGREQMPRLDQDFDRIERRLMQCVSGDTLVHTDQGVLPAKKLAGRTINTLSKNGIYRSATWKNYGEQELYEIFLENGDVLRATEFHRWPTCQKNGRHRWEYTIDLMDKRIPIQHYDSFDYDLIDWEEGVQHGLVYGDGWIYSNGKYSMIRQYAGNKHLLEDFFGGLTREVTVADGRNYLEVAKLPAVYKTDFPSDESSSYLRGFIAGLIAADGCVDDTGHVTLHSNDRALLEQVRGLCIMAGIPTVKISKSVSKEVRKTPGSQVPAGYLMYKLSFVKASFLTNEGVDERLLLKNSHRTLMYNSGPKRQRYSMRVVAVIRTGIYEETYCCAEDVTHSFVIENNYLTGNTFGINPSLLSGGAASQPYASSALQAEFLNQILRTYQGYLKRHYEARAKIVAEAQGHYAYEKRGDTRIPITEEVVEYDEETGEKRIVEKRKLLIPELRMKVLDLRDEATQRQFMQALKQQGVPIPDEWVAMGMHYVFDEALEKQQEEMIQKTVAQQEAKVKTYDILTAKGLPIPPDLKAEVEGMAAPQPGDTTTLGVTPPDVGGMVDVPPVGDQIMMPPPPPGGTPAIGPNSPMRGQRPEQSDERAPIPPPGQVPNNPMMPGIPGQPGLLGIPGAPKPAISSRQSYVERGEDEESGLRIVHELPRKQAEDFLLKNLHGAEDSATLGETQEEDDDAKA